MISILEYVFMIIPIMMMIWTEIARVRASSNKFIDLFPDTKVKVSVDVRIPAKEHPEVEIEFLFICVSKLSM